MSYQNISGVLGSSVATGGTFTATVPTPYDVGRYQGALGHVLEMNQAPLQSPTNFSLSFSGQTVTVTNKGTGTWAAGSAFTLQLNQPGDASLVAYASTSTTQNPPPKNRQPSVAPAAIDPQFALINFGAPATKSTTAILNASTAFQSAYVGVNAVTTPITVPGGCAGRALQVTSSSASDTTQTITVTGTDYLGATMSQAFALNGTSVISGTKAFATVTSITCSVAVTVGTISVGTLDVFGLPVPLNMTGLVIQDLTDGAKSGTQGTYVAADNTAGGSTTTTGDVRGTFAPNTASNGTHYYHLIMVAPDFYYPGEPQV